MKKINCIYIFFIITLSISFSFQSDNKNQYPLEPKFLEPGLKELASSKFSMVTSAHPFATNAGLEMLRRGGNAMDAAVAATLVVGVTEGNTSLAGGGALTYYDSKSASTIVINFEPNGFKADVLPYNKDKDKLTGRSTKVAGSFAGLHHAIEKYGALSWKDVLQPAIFYAEYGFPVHGGAYARMKQKYTTLTLQPSGKQIFAPNGFLPHIGEQFKQPEMAETLKNISEYGPDYFYRGPFTKKMVKAIQDIGGKATLEDFDSYRVLELEPIRGTFKEYQIVGPPPPGDSTVGFIESMNILENVELKKMGHYTQSVDSLQWIIETMRVMVDDISKFNGIPEYDRALGNVLISKQYAKSQYKRIRYKIEEAKRQVKNSDQLFQNDLIKSESEFEQGRGTHHVSSVDREGNVCSLMHTIYGTAYSYSGLFVGGLVLNAAGDFNSYPGERIFPLCGPPIIFKGEKPYFAPGSSGGTINPFFLIINTLIWEKNFKEAQEAPRFRVKDNIVRMEHRIDEKIINQLKKRGYQIEWVGPYSFGTAQIAGIDHETGVRYGASDPRSHGKAAGQ